MKSNLPPHPEPPEPTEAEIQHAAYMIWLESGKLPNHDLENWLAAREFLRHRHGRAGSRTHHPRTHPSVIPLPSAAPAENR
ncbi:MAG: DUF2934 domain-containing protein [Verrucomicrobia bacterium]|nr:DUF2934 domain-containing protein [Verrucomicrobiota bacterium]